MMKQATMLLVVLGALFTGSLNARADSVNLFGFETNKHPLEYEYCKKAKPSAFKSHYWYECSSAPRVHPDIEAYYLHFVEQVGLCAVIVDSFDPKAGPDKLEKMLKMFKKQLVQKYGPPTHKTEEEAKNLFDWD